MGLFKSKAEKELDSIIQSLEMNMANNYKDNAQANLKELSEAIGTMKASGVLKAGALTKYEGILDGYRDEERRKDKCDEGSRWEKDHL